MSNLFIKLFVGFKTPENQKTGGVECRGPDSNRHVGLTLFLIGGNDWNNLHLT